MDNLLINGESTRSCTRGRKYKGITQFLGMVCVSSWMTVAHGQDIVLNEVLASNTLGHSDIVDFGDYSDWIELHNTTGSSVSLDGYFLSDDPLDPFKWAIPSGGSVGANGYLLIWADGEGAGPGESHPRGYWPWANFTTESFHANFKVSSSGETITLTKATGITSQVLIAAEQVDPDALPDPIDVPGAEWKYLDDGSDQSTQWRARTFDDSTWSEGPSQLGYGDGDERTVLSYGGSSSNKHITAYFRHTFSVADPALFHGLTARMMADDGAVVYVNGNEVRRVRMPAGDISYTTLASGLFTEGAYESFNIPASHLVVGDNVVAVEIHQVGSDSSDISFDFELTAQSHTSSTLEDSVTFAQQVTDVSYGRDPSSPSTWVLFGQPSAGAVNNTSVVPEARVESSSVEFSMDAGFYSGAQSLTLSTADGGAKIYYTLNGDLPDATSSEYTTALPITATSVVRARAIESGKVPGPTTTRTYFFGETPGDVSFVSLVTDDANLFDNVKGIYENTHEPLVSGEHAVYKGKEIPASLEFFEKDGTMVEAVNAGVRIGGENNWRNAQKALTIYMRGKYGDDLFEYPLFDDSCVGAMGRMVLRNGGDNWSNTMLRDAIIPSVVHNRIQCDPMDYRPCVVFINGVYYGIHNIREKFDKQYFVSRFHVDPDNYDHCEFGRISSSSVTFGVAEGNDEHYLEMEDFITSHDMSVADNYAFAESRIDIDSFIDYAIIQDYVYNSSWRHNREFWRERKPGAKWRWLLPDLDRGLNISNIGSNLLDNLVNEYGMFGSMMDNPGFRDRLIQRYCAHMASTFEAGRIADIVDAHDTEVGGEVTRHIARWSADGGMTAGKRTTELQEMKDFASQRAAEVFIDLTSQFTLGATADLSLAQSSSAAGQILINGVSVSPQASVVALYTGLPFEISAVPSPGYEFTGWTGITGSATETITLTGNLSVTAQFALSGETVAPGSIASNTTFTAANSPYVAADDIVVDAGVTLTIEPGVEIRMPVGKNIRVLGGLQVQGVEGNPVNIVSRGSGGLGDRWGGLSFENATETSQLNHLTIRGASKGVHPLVYKAAISALNSTLVMDYLDLDEVDFPIFTRGGSTTLTNSRIYTTVTCDYINVKSGVGVVTGNVFLGNNAPDTDAVDFDDVVNGVIHDNYIYRFQGYNSDGIDIGEGCVNISLEGNRIYYNSDKGVSVGQGSTVVMKRNLVVGCNEAVAVKDTGSAVTVDQCSLVDNEIGVSSFEKNFLKGGGSAVVTNTIISNSGLTPVQVDALSTLTVDYSCSNTLPMTGSGNINMDPMFEDASILNFQLMVGSPCIDSGDPGHADDPDGSRADMGALYTYAASDYPFTLEKSVVINEVMANSGSSDPDWIELHNRSGATIDISGWFLSDSASDYAKYRIPEGTVLQPGEYMTFYEDVHFGASSIEPGRITPFAFSENGETAYLHSAESDELTDYLEKEDFGASRNGVSLGSYYKLSSGTYNFVALQKPTPSAENSSPLVGPVVISEIMYNSSLDVDDEYIELLNISDAAVTLYDSDRSTAWQISDGVDYTFSQATPVTMQPGERILLVKNLGVFNSYYAVPGGTQVFEWTSGKLSNGGERLQLSMPGGVDGNNERQWIRVDRVNYDDDAPWPTTPDGSGPSLSKVFEVMYGNDYGNWKASSANPATYMAGATFAQWVVTHSLPASKDGPSDDADGDGIDNLTEYTQGSDPNVWNLPASLGASIANGVITLEFDVDITKTDTDVWIEQSETLAPGSWQVSPVFTTFYNTSTHRRRVVVSPESGGRVFYRYVTRQKP